MQDGTGATVDPRLKRLMDAGIGKYYGSEILKFIEGDFLALPEDARVVVLKRILPVLQVSLEKIPTTKSNIALEANINLINQNDEGIVVNYDKNQGKIVIGMVKERRIDAQEAATDPKIAFDESLAKTKIKQLLDCIDNIRYYTDQNAGFADDVSDERRHQNKLNLTRNTKLYNKLADELSEMGIDVVRMPGDRALARDYLNKKLADAVKGIVSKTDQSKKPKEGIRFADDPIEGQIQPQQASGIYYDENARRINIRQLIQYLERIQNFEGLDDQQYDAAASRAHISNYRLYNEAADKLGKMGIDMIGMPSDATAAKKFLIAQLDAQLNVFKPLAGKKPEMTDLLISYAGDVYTFKYKVNGNEQEVQIKAKDKDDLMRKWGNYAKVFYQSYDYYKDNPFYMLDRELSSGGMIDKARENAVKAFFERDAYIYITSVWRVEDVQKSLELIREKFNAMSEADKQKAFAPNPNSLDNPFMFALVRGDVELFKFLEEQYENAYGKKPNLENYIFDIRGDRSLNRVDGQKIPLIHNEAACDFFREKLKEIVDKDEVTKDVLNKKNLMNIAAFWGAEGAVKVCIGKGANIFEVGGGYRDPVATGFNEVEFRGHIIPLMVDHICEKIKHSEGLSRIDLIASLASNGSLVYLISHGRDEDYRYFMDEANKLRLGEPQIQLSFVPQGFREVIPFMQKANSGVQGYNRIIEVIDTLALDFSSFVINPSKVEVVVNNDKGPSLSASTNEHEDIIMGLKVWVTAETMPMHKYLVQKSYINAAKEAGGEKDRVDLAKMLVADKENGPAAIAELRRVVKESGRHPKDYVAYREIDAVEALLQEVDKAKKFSLTGLLFRRANPSDQAKAAYGKITEVFSYAKELGINMETQLPKIAAIQADKPINQAQKDFRERIDKQMDATAEFELGEKIAGADLEGITGVSVRKTDEGFEVSVAREGVKNNLVINIKEHDATKAFEAFAKEYHGLKDMPDLLPVKPPEPKYKRGEKPISGAKSHEERLEQSAEANAQRPVNMEERMDAAAEVNLSTKTGKPREEHEKIYEDKAYYYKFRLRQLDDAEKFIKEGRSTDKYEAMKIRIIDELVNGVEGVTSDMLSNLAQNKAGIIAIIDKVFPALPAHEQNQHKPENAPKPQDAPKPRRPLPPIPAKHSDRVLEREAEAAKVQSERQK